MRVAELRHLFNAMDPAPLLARDLDPTVAGFIVDQALEVPAGQPFALLVHLDRALEAPDHSAKLEEAIRQYFARRAARTRRGLKELFRRGRISLAIGLGFLAVAVGLSGFLPEVWRGGMAGVASESLFIGGWVAMWRPLEVFLYDWWPIRAEARRFDRLAAMAVRVGGDPAEAPES